MSPCGRLGKVPTTFVLSRLAPTLLPPNIKDRERLSMAFALLLCHTASVDPWRGVFRFAILSTSIGVSPGGFMRPCVRRWRTWRPPIPCARRRSPAQDAGAAVLRNRYARQRSAGGFVFLKASERRATLGGANAPTSYAVHVMNQAPVNQKTSTEK